MKRLMGFSEVKCEGLGAGWNEPGDCAYSGESQKSEKHVRHGMMDTPDPGPDFL